MKLTSLFFMQDSRHNCNCVAMQVTIFLAMCVQPSTKQLRPTLCMYCFVPLSIWERNQHQGVFLCLLWHHTGTHILNSWKVRVAVAKTKVMVLFLISILRVVSLFDRHQFWFENTQHTTGLSKASKRASCAQQVRLNVSRTNWKNFDQT